MAPGGTAPENAAHFLAADAAERKHPMGGIWRFPLGWVDACADRQIPVGADQTRIVQIIQAMAIGMSREGRVNAGSRTRSPGVQHPMALGLPGAHTCEDDARLN
jgi:hypothetical protein